jgi:hypothetical protein
MPSRRYQEVFEKKKLENYSRKMELILLAPVVIKRSHPNLGEAYVERWL